MSDFLSQMAHSSAARAAAVTRAFHTADLQRPAYPLKLSGFDVIAEIKNRSQAIRRDLRDAIWTAVQRRYPC
jgi:hypothetical protein